MNASPATSGLQALTAVYGALAAGVFLFAAIVLFVLDPIEAGITPGTVRVIWFAFAMIAMLGAGVIRGRMAGGRDANQARVAALLVWALAEAQALVGITGTMITGDRVLTYGALAIFVWIWVRYPPRSFQD